MTRGSNVGHIRRSTALVTGAAQGIGRGIALRLARDGADVALLDVNQAAIESVISEINALGRTAMALAVDLYDVKAITPAVESIVAAWGRLDVFVNNAGIMRTTPMLEVSEEEWDTVLDLDLKAAFFCLQAAARVMTAQRSGRIVNIASVSGLGARPDHVHYAAAKAGLISLTYSAALGLAPYGITVNAICPGVVDTPLTRELHADRGRLAGIPGAESLRRMLERIPLGRVASPDEIGAAVASLVSDDAGYITGQVLCVDGGLRLRG